MSSFNTKKHHILITGGAGFIGAHTACELAETTSFIPLVLDNFSTGFKDFVKWGPYVEGDCSDLEVLDTLFNTYAPIACIHFAGSIEVGESVRNPFKYYENNVVKPHRLFKKLSEKNIPVIFSSSAAVYASQNRPITEQDPIQPGSPYGQTKAMVETLLHDYGVAYGLRSVALRYFNACGGDIQGRIGESHDPETHLIPSLLDFVSKKRAEFYIFGNDYPTPDGTCIRDYIHVKDLAQAHIKALAYLLEGSPSTTLNVGTGSGFSVRTILNACEAFFKKPIPVIYAERRPGDVAMLVADVSKMKSTLNWTPTHSNLEQIIADAWRWRSRNV